MKDKEELRDQVFVAEALEASEKALFVIPSEARDLLFFAKLKKLRIPRANNALRNDTLGVFQQSLQPVGS